MHDEAGIPASDRTGYQVCPGVRSRVNNGDDVAERDPITRELAKERILGFFPIVSWLPAYSRDLLRYDVIAGITLAAFAIPELIAYAQLAGLPPQYGLYAGIMAPIAYLLFGTIRQLSIGPSSSEAILLASVLGTLVIADPSRYIALAALTALLVAVIAFSARVFRLGFMVNLISGTVLKGFLIGTGLVIIISQIPKVLGIPGTQGGFIEGVVAIAASLGDTNVYALAIGLGGIALLFLIEHRFPHLPGTLIVVILSIVLMSATSLADRGVHVLGAIPGGLPALQVPAFEPGDPAMLFPLAFALFLLAYVETMSIGRSRARQQDAPVDANQELIALGASSFAAGIGQGFPIAGSFSRTEMNVRNRAKTPLTGAFAAGIIALVAVYLTGLFANLPEAIIGALIIVAVFHMVDMAGIRRIAAISMPEAVIAVATLFGVLVFGILAGVFIGVILSLLEMLFRVTYPHTAILGRIGDTDRFGDTSRHPENQVIPGVLIFRIDAPLIFANATTIKERIMREVQADPAIRLVILDMEASPIVDITAADMLGDLNDDLIIRGVALRIAEATGRVRDLIRKAGYEKSLGKIGQETKISTVLAEWEAGEGVEGSPETRPEM